jgi:hypothetical protein
LWYSGLNLGPCTAMQVLYHLSHVSSLFDFGYFLCIYLFFWQFWGWSSGSHAC